MSVFLRSKHKLMPNVTVKLFFKIQAWAEGSPFEWLIGNSLRYFIPFHLIKKKQPQKQLLCHPKSENIFQQLNKSSFLKSLMTDNQDTFNILPDQNCVNIFYSPGIPSRRWFPRFCLVLIGDYGTKPTQMFVPLVHFKDLSPCSPPSLRPPRCVWCAERGTQCEWETQKDRPGAQPPRG